MCVTFQPSVVAVTFLQYTLLIETMPPQTTAKSRHAVIRIINRTRSSRSRPRRGQKRGGVALCRHPGSMCCGTAMQRSSSRRLDSDEHDYLDIARHRARRLPPVNMRDQLSRRPTAQQLLPQAVSALCRPIRRRINEIRRQRLPSLSPLITLSPRTGQRCG